MAYSIVLFEDGVLAVPTKWLAKDQKTCRYPPDEYTVLNAIKTLQDVEDDWETHSILRIFSTAGNSKT